MNKPSFSLATKISILQTMTIPLWSKRASLQAKLFFVDPKLFIPLLVILERKIKADSEAQKVLQGMLTVLNLAKETIGLAWCLENNRNDDSIYTHSISSCDEAPAKVSSGAYELVCEQRTEPATKSQLERRRVYQALQYWQPKHCLFLGESFLTSSIEHYNTSESNYFFTHHPETLVENPTLKRATYQVLLALKAHVNRGVF